MGTFKTIKVCHLASGDLWAGAEVQLATLISGLIQYNDLDLTVILFNYGVLEERLKILNVPVWVIDENRNNSMKLVYKTSKILKKIKIDILHTHRYKENVVGAVASLIAGIKLQVSTVHGLSEPFRGFNQLKARFYNFCNLQVGRKRVKRIITVSHDINKTMAENISPSKLVTIHNGIDLTHIQGDRRSASEFRKESGFSDNCFVIGSVGRLMPVKGYSYLIKALKILLDEDRNVRLVIVGDGPERERLMEMASELGVFSRIIFYGFTEDVLHVMRAFDVFILSSLHEGISISLLEALASGIPVIATAVGGNPEIITHGESGLLIAPNDESAIAKACCHLLDNEELRAHLSQYGPLIVAKRFSREAMARKTHRLYKDLIN